MIGDQPLTRGQEADINAHHRGWVKARAAYLATITAPPTPQQAKRARAAAPRVPITLDGITLLERRCPDSHKHATTSTCYGYHLCRCDPCKRGAAAAYQARKAGRAA